MNNNEEITENIEEIENDEQTAVTEDIAAEEPKKKKKEKRSASREIFDWVEILALSLSFVLLLFSYVARQALVDGSSMRETFHDGERIIISNLFYTPKQGDVIVFQVPNSTLTDEPIIKRVIALSGQTVYIDFENWKVYVYDDGSLTVDEVIETVKPLDEPYIEEMRSYYQSKYGDNVEMRYKGELSYPYTVEDGKLFCMGDNRNGSTDSRSLLLKTVDKRYILGKVLIRLYPFTIF